MTALAKRVEGALHETRLFILGVQVLLGIQFNAGLERTTGELPRISQVLIVVALVLICVAFGLLILPGSYDRIVMGQMAGPRLTRVITFVIEASPLPVAFVLAIDAFIVTDRAIGAITGAALSVATLIVALSFWYALAIWHRLFRHHIVSAEREADSASEKPVMVGLEEKISNVELEARIVLPGNQALLGFQFIGVLLGGFAPLPFVVKIVYVASFGLVALSISLLMSISPYHRVGERGFATPNFYRYASRIITISMVPLGLGVAGDVYIVVYKLFSSQALAIVIALCLLTFFYALWFGYPYAHLIYKGRRSCAA
ncbi:MAG: DUF6328 family protein [Candidatus Binataceae bacterium]